MTLLSERKRRCVFRRFSSGRFFLLTILLFVPHLCCGMMAQSDGIKEGTVLYSIGAGYEWMSDAYSTKGLALDVRARYYLSERFFGELMGHWGIHDGKKNVMQQGAPFRIRDDRNTLLGAIGPGYDIFQTENQLLDVYIKGLIGYGVRSSRYDDYQSTSHDNGTVTLGCSNKRKGIAVVAGLGIDTRFKHWVLTPSVDVFYIGKEWNVAAMISVGILCFQ